MAPLTPPRSDTPGATPGAPRSSATAPPPVTSTITVTVEQYDADRGGEPVLRTYAVPLEDGSTVMDALLHIHEAHDPGLAFRCGCRNRDCGLCAVDVNGKPRLACVTALRNGLVIRPLGKLPVARDLIVDRRWIMPFLERFDLFVRGGRASDWPERLAVPAEHAQLSGCTECLSCLAACPSFEFGRDDSGRDRARLGGPYHFVKLAQLHWDPRDRTDRRAQAAELGVARCAECRRCACPLGIPIYRAAVAPLAARQ
jgi:succinate dehydrogenase/fumarate reductase iron-sulfur protein